MLVNVPRLDALLEQHAHALGSDFTAYRHHAYRVANFYCLLHTQSKPDLDKLAIAVAFHDLGIWTAHSFDYLPPSRALAAEHLHDIGHPEWQREIIEMIENHHKLRRCSPALPASVEIFRRADWVDVSRGRLRFGLARCEVAQVMALFPNAGFHRLLARLTLRHWLRHPLRPLPMFHW